MRSKTNHVHFIVNESPEGGFEARAVNHSIFTQGENEIEIRANIREAVECHFDDDEMPQVIHLHFSKEELLVL